MLAPPGIAPGGLQMAARVAADPHITVRRWYGQGVDARYFVRVEDTLARGVEIGELAAQCAPADTRRVVADVVQVGRQFNRHQRVRHRRVPKGSVVIVGPLPTPEVRIRPARPPT
ncbi:hypothetical protein D3C86_1733490 [compost metagenome]